MKCDINSIELGHRSHLDWKCGNRDNSETMFNTIMMLLEANCVTIRNIVGTP